MLKRAKLNLIGLDFPCTGKEAVRDGTVAEYPVTQFGGRYGWDSTIGEVVQDDGIAHRLGYSLKLVAEFTKAANGLYEIDMKIVPDVPETVQVGESLDEAVNVVAKFKSDAAGAAAVGSETSRTGLLDGGKKVKDGEYSLTFKNDRMKDKFMKKYASKLAESVELSGHTIDLGFLSKHVDMIPESEILIEDATAARELEIYIENDATIYKRRLLPSYKNLVTKMAREQYDSKKAAKLMMYTVNDAAKAYSKEYSQGESIFDKKTKEMVAANLVKNFEAEAKLGNYNDLLPKKYQ